MVWSATNRELKWEWMDRRDKTIVDSFKVDAASGGRFERIRDDDRVYLWTQSLSSGGGGGGGSNNSNDQKKWEMYWMQDLEQDAEDEILVQVNQYLMNPAEAAPGGAAAVNASDTSNTSNNNKST